MSDKVVELNCVTTLDIPPERTLNGALSANLQGVVVLGYDADGDEYFASSYADGGNVLWLLERCKLRLMRGGDDSDDS